MFTRLLATFLEIDAPNHFANFSATVYRSESILYSKRTVESLLSSHIKTIPVALKLQKLFLYVKIEEILLFVWSTKQTLSDIRLPRH